MRGCRFGDELAVKVKYWDEGALFRAVQEQQQPLARIVRDVRRVIAMREAVPVVPSRLSSVLEITQAFEQVACACAKSFRRKDRPLSRHETTRDLTRSFTTTRRHDLSTQPESRSSDSRPDMTRHPRELSSITETTLLCRGGCEVLR